MSDSKKYTIDEILKNFKSEKPKKTVFGNYRIEDNELVYRATSSEQVGHEMRWNKSDEADFQKAKKAMGKKIASLDGKLIDEEGKVILLEAMTKHNSSYGLRIQYFETNVIAKKLTLNGKPFYIGNNCTLDLVGRTVSYGNESRNSSKTEIQREMEGEFLMLPLDRFSGFDFDSFEIIDQPAPDTVTAKVKNSNYHQSYNMRGEFGERSEYVEREVIVSPILFTIGGQYFLSDVDRREIRYKFLNRFLIQLPKKCKSIEEAYIALKPKAVLEAEAMGKDVKRLGRWFFIPTEAPEIPELSIDEKFAVLASEARYGLSDQVIQVLTGNAKGHSREAAKLLEKIPDEVTLERGPRIKTGFKSNGIQYCIGEATKDRHAKLALAGWFEAVEAKGKSDFSGKEGVTNGNE